MDAILTHENADFDALAALLGAKKIYPTALAILPRRMNRNVRAFCALYCDVLPFTRPEDLPRQRFHQIVVVDSQGIQSARGVTPNTRIHFIDHHPLTRELKPTMTFSGGDTGATTTLFVEQIRQKELALTPVEASLLLLGIYEDTGSLSYVTTTPRDLRAAAFLLERGASLAIVNEFLHPPLTEAQHKLYQQLIEKIQMHHIAGHVIAIAAARADTYVEEISVLAHQLREMYDPAALFLLVQMNDHIQLVARSERTEIDVARIATAFGGGGHDKAAAALIRNLTLRQAKTRLVKLLKESVQPSLTVRDVMSFGVHTLDTTTTVVQAAEAMNRYGHEGFPVVRRGKLVGIVTRREIDRALRHKLLNTPIKNLMQKPASVSPDDPLEKVRTVMMENNLGQVPVVQDQHILGIVTRTDLIKPWNKQPATRAQEIAARLERWLPSELLTLLREASLLARDLGYSLYIVGGFVRDLLLNQPTLDLDLVVEGNALKLAHALQQKYGGRVHGHARFGTAKWIIKETRDEGSKAQTDAATALAAPLTALDFSTARTEFYAHPSALPEVETSSIKQDLHRRDFTINTLAICLAPERYGQLLDPFGGEADLQRGLIRVLHSLSFIEDPTRILRAARFEQRFGFKIEPRTARLIGDALGMLARVSGERLRHELYLIFRENEPEKALARVHALGALKAIFPALDFTEWHARKFAQARAMYAHPGEAMYLGLLTYHLTLEQIQQVSTRLRLPNAHIELLTSLVTLREEVEAQLATESLPRSTIYRLLEHYTDTALDIFSVATDNAAVRDRVTLFRTQLRAIAPALTGDDLKRMGVRPGPVYRDILARLRAARLDGEITTREEEEAVVQQMINTSGLIVCT